METTIDVNMMDLWEAIWSSDGSGITYWASAIRDSDGKGINLWTEDAEGHLVGNPQCFRIFIDDEEEWRDVTLEDLARGYAIAVKENAKHCGSYSVADLSDPDECTGDTLLQYAVFGELIYG